MSLSEKTRTVNPLKYLNSIQSFILMHGINYRKSLQLNPKNEHAQKILEENNT